MRTGEEAVEEVRSATAETEQITLKWDEDAAYIIHGVLRRRPRALV